MIDQPWKQMADPEPNDILRRMAGGAGAERAIRGHSPARALSVALARTAAHLWDLPLLVTKTTQKTKSLEDLAYHLPEGALMVLLDGPEGARGGAVLDRALVASLIEMQTIGKVQSSDPTDREPTPTDAAMIAPWLDEAMERSDVALRQEEGRDTGPNHTWAVGYRFGALAEDARSLTLVLDAPEFHLLTLEVEIDTGTRVGQLVLILPAEAEVEDVASEAGADGQGKAYMAASAELSVFAARKTLKLSDVTALSVGDVVPIDTLLLAAAELRAVDGTLVGNAKLGQLNGNWAIKLPGANVAGLDGIDVSGDQDLPPPQLPSQLSYDARLGADVDPIQVAVNPAHDASVETEFALPAETNDPMTALSAETGLPPDLPPPSENLNFE